MKFGVNKFYFDVFTQILIRVVPHVIFLYFVLYDRAFIYILILAKYFVG